MYTFVYLAKILIKSPNKFGILILKNATAKAEIIAPITSMVYGLK